MPGISDDTLSVLADIFSNTGRTDKISVKYDMASRDITVTYVHLDPEWFKELVESMEAK